MKLFILICVVVWLALLVTHPFLTIGFTLFLAGLIGAVSEGKHGDESSTHR